MTTYYFGDIEFGEFLKGNGDKYDIAIVHRVDEVRDFDNDYDADEYCNEHYPAYLDVNTTMEVYFRKR